jgi:hypothetical protein
MNGEEDIRSMLAKRAKVPPRDNSLKLGNSTRKSDGRDKPPHESGETEAEFEDVSLQAKTETHLEDTSFLSSSSPNDVNHIEAELEKLPKTGKRLAIHLEEQVRKELMSFCDRHELTPEVLLEAIFVNFQFQYEKADSKKLAKIITDARERLATRKKVGLLKRTLSMINKIKK